MVVGVRVKTSLNLGFISSITASQDAHKRLVLQVYLGTLSSVTVLYVGKSFVSRL